MTTKTTKTTRATKKIVATADKKPAAKIVEAPAPAPVAAKPPVNRRVAAFKAHRTMLQTMLKATRSKAQRAELLAKIAEYDRQIAA